MSAASSGVKRIDPDAPGAVEDDAVAPESVDLGVDLAGLSLPNPVLSASGCFASGAEIDRFYDITELGAVVVKSVTLEPREGLSTPRMAETPSGMLNAIGLQNPGVDRWVERDLPWLRSRGARIVVSVAGKTVEDYQEVTRRLRHAGGIAALEVNLSCPNVESRGLVFACDPDQSAEVVHVVQREADVPVFAKLTSDVTAVVDVARSVVEAGADGLTLINTLLGMDIDPVTGRPGLANTYGGLSGPAIKPVALRNVHQVASAMPDVPIIGCGGARSATDVVEFVRAGANAVQIGTATFVDPLVGPRVIAELRSWLGRHGIERLADLRGTVQPW